MTSRRTKSNPTFLDLGHGINVAAELRTPPDLLEALGFTFVRFVVNPAVPLPSDELLASYAAHGIYTLGIVARESGPMVELMDFLHKLDFVQLGNEPDGADHSSWKQGPGEVLELFSMADLLGLKRLVLPGLVSGDPSRLRALLPLLSKENVAGVAIHPYGRWNRHTGPPIEGWGWGTVDELIAAYKAAMPRRYGNIIVTEFGMPINEAGTYERQMNYLSGVYESLTELGIPGAAFCIDTGMVEPYGIMHPPPARSYLVQNEGPAAASFAVRRFSAAVRSRKPRYNVEDEKVIGQGIREFAEANGLRAATDELPYSGALTDTGGLMLYDPRRNEVRFYVQVK